MAPSRSPLHRWEGKGGLQTAPFTVRDIGKSIAKSPATKNPDLRGFDREVPLFDGVGTDIYQIIFPATAAFEPLPHASCSRHHSHRPRSLYLAPDCVGDPVLAGRVQCREHPQPVRCGGGGVPLPDHRAPAGADPQFPAQSGRARHLADHPDPAHHVHRTGDHLLHLSGGVLSLRDELVSAPIYPWRASAVGISVALRVTPRGGRDDIEGIETLSDGRSVLKL